MNRVPVIICNPAYVDEAALDEDGIDPADLAPLVSGNAPIVTAPASENGDVTEDQDEDIEMEDMKKILRDILDNLVELHKEVKDLLSPTPGAQASNLPL